MVDLSRDDDGRVHARLLDLVPGRSKKVHADWLDERGKPFRQGVEVAALDLYGATSPRSTTSSKTPPRCSMPYTSSSSAPTSWTSCAAGSSRTPPATAAARAILCSGSRPSCAPAPRSSRPSSRLAGLARSEPTTDTRRFSPPGSAPSSGGPHTRPRTWLTDDTWPRAPSPRSTPARSPMSPASAEPCASRSPRSRPTSPSSARRRRHRGHERHHRAPPPSCPRLPQLRQLPPAHAPRRRRTHPRDPHRIGEEPPRYYLSSSLAGGDGLMLRCQSGSRSDFRSVGTSRGRVPGATSMLSLVVSSSREVVLE